ncbi:MAG: GNAT family N-acetyltransferase [Brumimicrobium sp.]|nr:GNAT family N-acetyltransferase [Brumimicrobium sp.]MCO5269971.1 GNAT family N-acetyltransferase [Brumimicrobium sp.]
MELVETSFRQAAIQDIPTIWKILQDAILRRKEEGSNQWQDGYPNLDTVENDIQRELGYVLVYENDIIGYTAILINEEPAYQHIQGQWLTEDDFVVFHRVAIAEKYVGKGFAKIILDNIEQLALSKQIYSIKADTNFDNLSMLHLFEKMGYSYCGEVMMRNSSRKAFEKVLR